MKRRDKWILIVVIIGCSACGIAMVADLVYGAVWIMRDLKSMKARRLVLLYETDHRELLEACRNLSMQVATGRLEPGSYRIHSDPDPESKQFPQLILSLDPLNVEVAKDGKVALIMSPMVMYGVRAHPENYEDTLTNPFKYRDTVWGIELIDGLWYFDEDFQKHPEHMKEVEESLKKRKAEDQRRRLGSLE